MTVNGIIAEYNPFHNGHLHHINVSKEVTGADYTIVVMSGNFTQRGEPAIIDKFTRAEMALVAGADLVIELPIPYATASAEHFALGGVTLLDKLQVVTHLCFGSEAGAIAPLEEVATLLTDLPAALTAKINDLLKTGLSYPSAREEAIRALYGESYSDSLSQPNNILGIEYLGLNSLFVSVLTLLKMDNVLETDLATLFPEMTLGELCKVIAESHRNIFPVIDHEGRLMGVLLLDEVRNIMFQPRLYNRFHVSELMTSPQAILQHDMAMERVMQIFEDTGAWNLPVVDEEKRYLGFVSKSKIFNSYRRVLVHFSEE